MKPEIKIGNFVIRLKAPKAQKNSETVYPVQSHSETGEKEDKHNLSDEELRKELEKVLHGKR